MFNDIQLTRVTQSIPTIASPRIKTSVILPIMRTSLILRPNIPSKSGTYWFSMSMRASQNPIIYMATKTVNYHVLIVSKYLYRTVVKLPDIVL